MGPSEIYFLPCQVYHSRQETAKNSFQYPVLNILFDVECQAQLQHELKKRYGGVLAFHSTDHFPSVDPSQPLYQQVSQFVWQRFQYRAEKVYLQTIPRMLGYVFNPVSFWYFYRQDQLEAVLCEVNNTFGEKHYYWLYQQGQSLNQVKLKTKKEFHVSPFFDLQGHYEFCFVQKPQSLSAHIKLLQPDGSLRLNTWIKGEMKPLATYTRWQILMRYGWMTPLVMLRIHYQAFKLWCKRVRFYSKPVKPIDEVTRNDQTDEHLSR